MKVTEIRDGVLMLSPNIGQHILPGHEGILRQEIAARKEQITSKYFTNLDMDIVAVKDTMPGVIAGALSARTSRAPNDDIREVFWTEFVLRPEFGVQLVTEQIVQTEQISKDQAHTKAEEIIGRVLSDYGDDSVREQASGYVAVKGHTVLSSMRVFREKLLKAIEASTRYIDWGKRNTEGEFRYQKNEKLMNSQYADVFTEAMDGLFETYEKIWPQLWNHVVEKNPQGEVPDIPYKTAIRGRVCDNLRKLLPLGILTNYVLHADYRTLSEVIMNLRASPLDEDKNVANGMASELMAVNRKFIEVVESKHSKPWTESRIKIADTIRHGIGKLLFGTNSEAKAFDGVLMRVTNADWKLDLAKGLIDSDRKLPEDQLNLLAAEMVASGRFEEVLKDIGASRNNRRHKVPDAFQRVVIEVTFDGLSISGIKDFNRQRNILDKSVIDTSATRGIYIPDDLKTIGGEALEMYVAAQEKAIAAYNVIKDDFPEEAKLLLTHGTKSSITIQMGLAEAFWVAELRSIASGDPEYRRYAQDMWKKMIIAMPELEKMGSFVDMNEYPLNRIKEAVAADLHRGESEVE